MPPAWIPVALLLCTLLGEVQTWRDFKARSAPSPLDRGSLLVNNVLGLVSLAGGLASGLALRGSQRFAVPAWLAWAGIALALGGTGLRAWAVATLGRWFSLTIQVRPGQPVVERGPYRILRHPSYAGGDLAFAGIGLSAGNWLSPVLYVVPWLLAHLYRIRVEERALKKALGAPYEEYCRHTWRLVPFVW